jgi:hypothetical protein
MISRLVASAALAVLLSAGSVQAQGPLKSGPPVGTANDRSGFYPQYVTGPCAGQRLCPV